MVTVRGEHDGSTVRCNYQSIREQLEPVPEPNQGGVSLNISIHACFQRPEQAVKASTNPKMLRVGIEPI